VTDAEKLSKISAVCSHPALFGWSGADLARVIRRVLDGQEPVIYTADELNEPIHYELVHDAVYEDGLS
jgi:hypothetical protein